jgi:hypothetical protein
MLLYEILFSDYVELNCNIELQTQTQKYIKEHRCETEVINTYSYILDSGQGQACVATGEQKLLPHKSSRDSSVDIAKDY